jgi:hypothetical protein
MSRSRQRSRSRSCRHLPSTRFLAVTRGGGNRDFGPDGAEKTGPRTAFDSRTGEEERNRRSDPLLCGLLTPRPRRDALGREGQLLRLVVHIGAHSERGVGVPEPRRDDRHRHVVLQLHERAAGCAGSGAAGCASRPRSHTRQPSSRTQCRGGSAAPEGRRRRIRCAHRWAPGDELLLGLHARGSPERQQLPG